MNFIGNPRKNSKFIPGYVFKIKNDKDYKNLAGVLTKCFFEVNNKQEFEKAIEEGDEEYLAQQLETDLSNKDVDMKEVDEAVDDYDFKDAIEEKPEEEKGYTFRDGRDQDDYHRLLELIDQSEIRNEEDDEEEYDEEEEEEKEEHRDKGYQEGVNKELIQA